MSNEEGVPEIVSEFPAPPKFFALYVDGVDSGPLPPEPMEPTYHMFGSPYSTQDVVPDLLPQPGKKLYAQGKENDNDSTPIDYKLEMKKYLKDDYMKFIQTETDVLLYRINRSLLANFVGLVDVLIKTPAMFNAKLDDIELLFLNLHNLINAFRPHQARETVIQMLKTQVQQRRDAARDIRRVIDESRQAVEHMHKELHDPADDTVAVDGVSSTVSDNDVKMENIDGLGATGNGNNAANAMVAALTCAQREQTEVTRNKSNVSMVVQLIDTVLKCLRYAEFSRSTANSGSVLREIRGHNELIGIAHLHKLLKHKLWHTQFIIESIPNIPHVPI